MKKSDCDEWRTIWDKIRFDVIKDATRDFGIGSAKRIIIQLVMNNLYTVISTELEKAEGAEDNEE